MTQKYHIYCIYLASPLWDLGKKRNKCQRMLFVAPWVMEFFVSDPGPLCFLLAPMKLSQADLLGCQRVKLQILHSLDNQLSVVLSSLNLNWTPINLFFPHQCTPGVYTNPFRTLIEGQYSTVFLSHGFLLGLQRSIP